MEPKSEGIQSALFPGSPAKPPLLQLQEINTTVQHQQPRTQPLGGEEGDHSYWKVGLFRYHYATTKGARLPGWVRGHAPVPGNFIIICLKRAHFLHSRPEFQGKRLQFPAKCGPLAIWGFVWSLRPPLGTGLINSALLCHWPTWTPPKVVDFKIWTPAWTPYTIKVLEISSNGLYHLIRFNRIVCTKCILWQFSYVFCGKYFRSLLLCVWTSWTTALAH